jgi:uncharacterized delta-60 repeat protein
MKNMPKVLCCVAGLALLVSCVDPIAQPVTQPFFTPGAGVKSIAEQSDGKVIISGAFTQINGVPVNHFARVNPDRTLDRTFNAGGSGMDGSVWTIHMLGSNKILVAGWFSRYNGDDVGGIARLNSDGSRDTTFLTGTGFNDYVNAGAVQGDNKAILCGYFTSYNRTEANRIVRLNTDGSIDGAFNPGGTGANNIIWDICLQSDGKSIICGSFTAYNGVTVNRVARLNTDGTLDSSFNPGGSGASLAVVWKTRIVDGGKIIIAGEFSTYNGISVNRVARLNADGTLDATFNNGGAGADNSILALAIQNDGKILIGGTNFSYNNPASHNAYSICRLQADGAFDSTFSPGLADSFLECILPSQNGGRIFIGGDFASYNGTPLYALGRLNSDGSLIQ